MESELTISRSCIFRRLIPRNRALVCLLLVVLISTFMACSVFKPSSARDRDKPCSVVTSRHLTDLSKFFSLNGITPFHHHVSKDANQKKNLLPDLQRNLKKAKELGAHSMRIDMWWGIIQPEPDRFDWDLPDLVIDEICRAGLEPYPILCYNSIWSSEESPATNDERERFGIYVYNMVKRYKGKVKRWEVWNEPNIRPFWVPTPRPDLYAELLKVAYAKAKEADPECTVVGMCTAGADYGFIEECYAEGSKGYMDALSFHHYSGNRNEAELENEIRKIRRIMQRYGDADLPILITELGIGSGKNEHR